MASTSGVAEAATRSLFMSIRRSLIHCGSMYVNVWCAMCRSSWSSQDTLSVAMKIFTVAALALTVLAGACARQEVNNAEEKAALAAAPSGDWPMYGGRLAGDRYSPVAQITVANVG